tara:strand:+ start:7599 stop:8378 length:780 start_codon:yes stop_codon:yes gene_type:complete
MDGGLELASTDVARWLGSLLWPFVRISSFLVVSPIFGARSITRRVRIILALLVAWLLLPSLPVMPAVEPFSAPGMLITAQQVLVGVAMGFVFQLAFSTVVVAGQSIAMSMGLGFASAIDPQNGVQVPMVSQFYMILATLLFLSLNGHLLVIDTVHESFRILPIGVAPPNELAWKITLWGSQMFASGLLLALPALAALLLINLAFGVMTRSAPQLNIFAVGFPVTLTAGFILIFFGLPNFGPQVSDIFDAAFELMTAILE